jgi:predicted transcriptional regulator
MRKSEVVTVRLDPKLKYLAELAARRLRRTLSSYIEWAIEDSLSHVHLQGNASEFPVTVADQGSTLWDVDEPDRFAKLALNFPDLLDHEEQRIWKLVQENGLLWRGSHAGPREEWKWQVREEKLIWDRLREHWETFRDVARGEKPLSALPKWEKYLEKFDRDDDIPF